MEKEFYIVKKKYLADALSFLGYNYFKNGYGKNTTYSFKKTEDFLRALKLLLALKESVGKNNME